MKYATQPIGYEFKFSILIHLQHNFVPSTRVFGQYSRGHFGLSLAFLGDINADGYGDLAVGAPQTPNPSGSTATGAVYIFLGGRDGLQNKPSQVNSIHLVQFPFHGLQIRGNFLFLHICLKSKKTI